MCAVVLGSPKRGLEVGGMIEEWRYQRRLKQLHRERRGISARYKPLLEDARKRGRDAHDSLMADVMNELAEIEGMIAEVRHRRTMDLAQSYDVPTKAWSSSLADDDSDGDDNWQRSRFSGQWFITEAEAARLRAAVRQERKERFEDASRWLPPFVSVLSLAVAILALLHKH